MNIPVGEMVEENVSLKEMNLRQKLSKLMRESFSGSVVLTVEGRSGIEEGLVLLKEGMAFGALYEYIRFGKIVYGETALKQLLNSATVEFGVMDVGSLTKQQIELIIAFNEKIELKKPLSEKDIAKLMPKKYDAGVAEKEIGKELKKKESKFDIFRRLGLGGVH